MASTYARAASATGIGVAPAHTKLIPKLNAVIKAHQAQIKQSMKEYNVGILP